MSLDPDARYLGEVHDCPVCHMQPGSDTAREAGCTCPIYDNGHGHGDRLVYRLDCPVEHPTREDESNG
jgi:hypothetical protein